MGIKRIIIFTVFLLGCFWWCGCSNKVESKTPEEMIEQI